MRYENNEISKPTLLLALAMMSKVQHLRTSLMRARSSFVDEEMYSLKLAPPRGAKLLAPSFRKNLAPISSSTQAASLKNG